MAEERTVDREAGEPLSIQDIVSTRKELSVRLVPRASELRCPALLIVGRHDPQTSVRVSRALHARIGGSQLVIFERSGRRKDPL